MLPAIYTSEGSRRHLKGVIHGGVVNRSFEYQKIL